MGKSLVIVESPAKAKTINKYLGKDFIVKSSVGHIRDLPTSSSAKTTDKAAKTAAEVRKMSAEEKAKYKKQKEKKALVARMGVDPENGWKAQYQILSGKEKVVNELQKLAENADCVYLATDLDREGEAIAWHLQQIIGGDESRYQRVVFNEITKSAIQDAFSKPSELDTNMVNAQQARRFLDRVVGFMVSPLLWKKVARGLSAGRVQSVAVRLVVEREGEIKAFVPEEYWDVFAELQTAASDKLKLEVVKYKGDAFKPKNESEANVAVSALSSAGFKVVARDVRGTSSKPSAPYITSTLQQAASTRLGFGVKKTMMLAQRLYEAGHITYMRTDSTNLSQEALDNVREMISSEFGTAYLPENPIRYGSKQGAQEAHEAIRPSNVKLEAAFLNEVERDAQRLYELIWRQFVACQMTPAQYDATKLKVEAGDYLLTASGRTLKFDGWTKVQPAIKKKNDEESDLPMLSIGDVLSLDGVEPNQHFTKPPARFSEASLVKELEKRGIGRPSTYATIISTIQDRGYVKVENRRFYAEKMGEIVSERLVGSFPDLMSYDFTADMEQTLDDVAHGELDWKNVLDGFYKGFTGKIEKAELEPDEGGMKPNHMVETDIECPTCHRHMGIRTGSTGVFLGCSGYALPPKERCKTTMNLTPGDEAVSDIATSETDALRAMKRCQICGTAMDSYLIDESRKLHVCGQNPSCEGYEVEKGTFKIKGYDGPLIECDRCSADMELKNGRFGKYFGCTNEECKNTRKLLKNGEVAPPKEDPIFLPELKCTKSDAHFVLRDGAAGIFLAASTFPRSRETRAPLIEELVKYKSLLWDKYSYLADAPTKDDQGNKTVVKFSRKTKEQYVVGDKEGKPSGFVAKFVDGKWNIESKAKVPKKK
ncbi:type I DNA topoisomerase [Shewanella sp. 202IG2-18]|uniref:type I DNA topoisomerase n=1 Tax=Parashewanella hymeniacidonis TaxID=2807618 RepID=UPI00196071A1|nr:type I DNA topoisomerase [Parashewanella hymeniacidonis]MBM7074391.1 type I DNA topoisomerase [Parashewanella hymeniacidonis]